MDKQSYLSDNDVQEFISWLAANLNSDQFQHSYTIRRGRKKWHCDSLFNAFEKYEWGFSAIPNLGIEAGSTFDENANALSALQTQLRKALDNEDDVAAYAAAVAIVRWGGVANGNVSWLTAHQEGLADCLIHVRDLINQQRLDELSKDVRFNAGMTKVYSLACDELIIYDSRVGAALGWLVVRFCAETGRAAVPANLDFPWAPAKEAADAKEPKNRCPNRMGLSFQRLYNAQPKRHAIWNVYASWLLSAVLGKARSTNQNPFDEVGLRQSEQLRAFEAALFMIGYDLGGGVAKEGVKQTGKLADRWQKMIEEEGWREGFTRARGNPFYYQIASDTIIARYQSSTKIADFPYEVIAAILYALKKEFSFNAFPLSNSIDHVPAGTAEYGLGTVYYEARNRRCVPSHTSHLAAILEDFGVFIPTEGPRAGKYWRINPEFDGLIAKNSAEAVKAFFLERAFD